MQAILSAIKFSSMQLYGGECGRPQFFQHSVSHGSYLQARPDVKKIPNASSSVLQAEPNSLKLLNRKIGRFVIKSLFSK
jgi:hypothetical protein